MTLDLDRIAAVLAESHSYYGGREPGYRADGRMTPGTRDFLGSQFRAGMVVLDVGCGNGGTLIAHAGTFAEGLGIDNDPAHLALADKAAAEAGTTNLSFRLLEVDQLPSQGWADRFDLVFTERGPFGYESRGIQAALSVLRTDGLIFCESIGDLHHQELREVFGAGPRFNQAIRSLDQVRVAMERNGVGIRVAADIITKRYYPDPYEWLRFQCGIWAWAGAPLPAPDDPRIGWFVERNSASGEIETTHHVVWVAGVKLPEPPGYVESPYFPADRRSGLERHERS